MKTPKVTVVADLQYGSTGKGALVGYLNKQIEFDATATGWGTNSGHTMIIDDMSVVCTQIPNSAVFDNVKVCYIGPGSLINPDKFMEELTIANYRRRTELQVVICDTASVITNHHILEEATRLGSIGSTMKGNSAAIKQKLDRNPVGSNTIKMSNTRLNHHPHITIVDPDQYVSLMKHCDNILLEGCQGFSLGINQRFYPYCTSRECTPAGLCLEAGVPIAWIDKIWGTLRTYPIRVANRPEVGGWSGPTYGDQIEIPWGAIGIQPETTTVTKLQRRLFTFSMLQLKAAMNVCNPDHLFLNFCNYLDEGSYQTLTSNIDAYLESMGDTTTLELTGWGPDSIKDIVQYGDLPNHVSFNNSRSML